MGLPHRAFRNAPYLHFWPVGVWAVESQAEEPIAQRVREYRGRIYTGDGGAEGGQAIIQ